MATKTASMGTNGGHARAVPESLHGLNKAVMKLDFAHLPIRKGIRKAVQEDASTLDKLIALFPEAKNTIYSIVNESAPVQSFTLGKTVTSTIKNLGAAPADASTDRVNTSLKTPTGQFSEVFAVSQGLLNQSFQILFALNDTLQTIKYSSPHWGSIDADLIAPQISLSVSNNDLPLWYMNFGERGTMSVWSDDANDFVNISTSNWVFVFALDFGNIPIVSGSTDYNNIVKALGTADVPGDYTISRLIMDFSTAQVVNFRADLCNFNGYVMTADIQTGFTNFVNNWLITAQKANAGTIGYVWTTPNPNAIYSQAPTFPPTDKIYQTYPYYGPGWTTPKEGLGDGDNNMLLYLEMTQGLPFPKERLLAYSANWTTPTIPASMCIGRSVFFESYLLKSLDEAGPLLTLLNSHTYIAATSASASYGLECSFSWGYTSFPDNPNSFYNWVPKGNGWVWTASTEKDGSDNSSPGCSATANITSKSSLFSSNTSNKIEIAPGGNSVKISGTTSVTESTDIEVTWIHQTGSATVTNTWAINMTAESILQGGLQLNMNLPAKDTDLFQITSSTSTNWLQPDSDTDKVKNQMLAGATMGNVIRQTATTLQSALSGTGKFFLPGAGTLLYKNPIYNNENDLLVEASYNGVDDFMGRTAAGRMATVQAKTGKK